MEAIKEELGWNEIERKRENMRRAEIELIAAADADEKEQLRRELADQPASLVQRRAQVYKTGLIDCIVLNELSEEDEGAEGEERLRTKYSTWKTAALKKHAIEAGASKEQLAAAAKGRRPRKAMPAGPPAGRRGPPGAPPPPGPPGPPPPRKIVILSRFVALSVSLIQKASLLQPVRLRLAVALHLPQPQEVVVAARQSIPSGRRRICRSIRPDRSCIFWQRWSMLPTW